MTNLEVSLKITITNKKTTLTSSVAHPELWLVPA